VEVTEASLKRGSYRGGLETENRKIKRPKTEKQKIIFFSKKFKTENHQIRLNKTPLKPKTEKYPPP